MNTRNISKRFVGKLLAFSATFLMLGLTLISVKTQATISAITIGVSSSSSSVQVGSNFTITVNVTTAGTVTDVLAILDYDVSKVTYQSADFSGMPHDQDFGSSNSTGFYTLDRYKLGGPYPSGTFNVAKLTFTAKAAGSAVFAINNAASSAGSGDPADSGAAHSPQNAGSTTVTITAPSTPPPVTNTTQNTAVASPKKTTTTPNPNATAPTAAEQGLPNDEPVVVAAENEIIDQGYAATIKVVNKDGSPRQGANVALNGEEKKTDESGTAIFEGLAAGPYDVTIDGKVLSVTVESTDKATAQEFVLTADENDMNGDLLKYVAAGALALLVIIVLARAIFKKMQFKRRFTVPTAAAPAKGTPQKVSDDFFKAKTPEVETVIRPTEPKD
jgi:hypothetical protein